MSLTKTPRVRVPAPSNIGLKLEGGVRMLSFRVTEQLLLEWSESPLFVKVESNPDGTVDLCFSRPTPPREATT